MTWCGLPLQCHGTERYNPLARAGRVLCVALMISGGTYRTGTAAMYVCRCCIYWSCVRLICTIRQHVACLSSSHYANFDCFLAC